jgi:hypothetical protein
MRWWPLSPRTGARQAEIDAEEVDRQLEAIEGRAAAITRIK